MRVSRNGNARTLTVPAEIAAVAQIELGDEYMVEVIDGDLVYQRVGHGRPRGRFVGDGGHRCLELPRGAAMPVGADPIPRALTDWDF